MAARFIYTHDTGDSWEHQIVELKAPLKPGDEDRSDPLSDIRNANFAIASTSIHLWHDVDGKRRWEGQPPGAANGSGRSGPSMLVLRKAAAVLHCLAAGCDERRVGLPVMIELTRVRAR
jgi:hypothetical protein